MGLIIETALLIGVGLIIAGVLILLVLRAFGVPLRGD